MNTSSLDTGLPTAADLLNKLRAQYGGENIDKINTLKETSTLGGSVQIDIWMDIIHQKIRIEMRGGSAFRVVRQLEGNNGWEWSSGEKIPLTQNGIKKMKLVWYTGIRGLHKSLNSYFLKGTVSRSGDDYVLTFFINEGKIVYLVASDFTLKGNTTSFKDGTPALSVYKKFAQTNGITFPTITEGSYEKTRATIKSTIEVNPVFTDETWKTP